MKKASNKDEEHIDKIMFVVKAILADPKSFFSHPDLELDLEDHINCNPYKCHAFGCLERIYRHPIDYEVEIAVEQKPNIDEPGHITVRMATDKCCHKFVLRPFKKGFWDTIS